MVYLVGKAVLVLAVGLIMRWPETVGVRLALILAHGGEFGLLILTQAMWAGVLDPHLGQSAVLALAVTMALAPLLIQHHQRVVRWLALVWPRWQVGAERASYRLDTKELSDHVLLCGCGRVGRLVAVVLEAANVPYIAIEFDLAHFRRAKREGHKVVFGDASRRRVLETAGLARARVVVITFDRRLSAERVLHYARQFSANVPSIISTADDRDLVALTAAGATTVFPENLAAGLALADQVLLLSGFSQENAAKAITAVRAELNPELGGAIGI
jgi:CPA2 family monovalent cation:H+ antiporter-2